MRNTWCVLFLMATSAASAGQSSPNGAAAAPRVDRKTGTVCVLPNPSERPTRISPGGDYNPATLTVRIDKGQPILWPHKKSVKVENLALNERHLIVLTSNGTRIQSLWFRFSDYKETTLCLYFDGYQGVQLGDKETALWCKCK